MKSGDVKRIAKDRGATVKNKGKYDKVYKKGRKESIYLPADDNENIPTSTLNTIWKWMKIIGLMAIVLLLLALKNGWI